MEEQRSGWKASVFGNYENRIREMSSPEKVFGYFASVKQGDEQFMTPQDFLRAITPFNPFIAADLPDELPPAFQRVMHIADPNGDGLISFAEYVFFTSLLAIPPKYFEVAFRLMDRDRNNTVDSNEFRKVMKVIQSHNPILQAARVKSDILDDGVLLPGWFGLHGEKQLSYEQFHSFLHDLHASVREVYFCSLDKNNDGRINAKEFAVSLVNFASVKNLDGFAPRINNFPETLTASVSLEDFQAWKKVMENIDEIDEIITLFVVGESNEFSIKDLQRAVKAVTNVKLAENQLAVALHVFDDDGNGVLSRSEFFDVLRKTASFGLTKPRDFGLERFVVCCKDCITTRD